MSRALGRQLQPSIISIPSVAGPFVDFFLCFTPFPRIIEPERLSKKEERGCVELSRVSSLEQGGAVHARVAGAAVANTTVVTPTTTA